MNENSQIKILPSLSLTSKSFISHLTCLHLRDMKEENVKNKKFAEKAKLACLIYFLTLANLLADFACGRVREMAILSFLYVLKG